MRCETAQRALSESMDERFVLPARVEAHAATCSTCARFASAAWRVRTAVRFEVAPSVPDLAPAIMAAVREETTRERLPSRPPLKGSWLARHRAALAAATAGFVVGAFLTAGGLFPASRENSEALAMDIPRRLVAAAEGLEGYRATFDIAELHWTRAVPRRSFVASIAFRAPESFRVDVTDTTAYPSPGWPRNDLELRSNGQAWVATGPNACPRQELPACPGSGPIRRVVSGRAPFDASTAMPTDVIVPMTVLAASERVKVLGPDTVNGHPAIAVQLAYQDATPLFKYLRFLGSWRPFFPQDRVIVWLDRATWFPLKYAVFPAPGPERRLWSAQSGLPREAPGRSVFTASVRSLKTTPPPARLFGIDSSGGPDSRQGFVDLTPAGLSSGPDARVLPRGLTASLGLRLWRYGRFERTDARPFDESVVAYADGLAWVTVARVTRWNQSRLFGVGSFAQPVELPMARGVAYYEPAGETQPRRLAVHTARGELLISTNLPRRTLLGVTESLPVGLPAPHGWLVRRWAGGVVEDGLTPKEAEARAGFAVLQPSWLPSGYGATVAEVARPTDSVEAGPSPSITLVFRRAAAELDGMGLVLYQSPNQVVPPPSGPEQAVTVQGVVGRWTPEQHLLEWTKDGTYVSLQAPASDLTTLLRVANSLRPPQREGAGP
jgi:hypothetical protein